MEPEPDRRAGRGKPRDDLGRARPGVVARIRMYETISYRNGYITQAGTPTLQAISEFVLLWTCVQDQPPLNSDEDSFIWQLTANGKYSPASAYKAFFNGTIEADYARAL
jgi:hypothetical protein